GKGGCDLAVRRQADRAGDVDGASRCARLDHMAVAARFVNGRRILTVMDGHERLLPASAAACRPAFSRGTIQADELHGKVRGMNQSIAPHLLFGLDPMWVSLSVLAVTYALIIAAPFNHAIVALIAAVAVVIIGLLDQSAAIGGIDWNTIGLLAGMMILVSISRRSGLFQYLAIWSAQAARAHPAGILFLLQITTAVLSAFLDNVTTVLLIVPVTLAICKELEVPV